MKHLPRVMLAAPKSGSGKTLITCALLSELKKRGVAVTSCKSGPDYIDPQFHKQVLGVPARNLDTYFTDPETTVRLLAEEREEGTRQYVVMEGVMGLFDGAGGTERMGSSYDLAAVTKTPVILVLDAKGAGFSVVPMIAGFMRYDSDRIIKGVILNRTSGAMAERLAGIIEEQCGVPLIGYFPNRPGLSWESRYLGLTLPEEIEGVREMIAKAGEALSETVPIERILALMETAEDLPAPEEMPDREISGNAGADAENARVRIAVARDEAFCFYYEENMRLLKRIGAEVVPFSPIHDTILPDDISGLYMGGGYPELSAKALSENVTMRESIAEALKDGMPLRAECGGFMYLHRTITNQQGETWPMVGYVDADASYTGKSQRFGYAEFTYPDGLRVKGHEFHYFDSTDNGADVHAEKPVTGRQYASSHVRGNQICGFPHLYYPSEPRFAEKFVKEAREYCKRSKDQ